MFSLIQSLLIVYLVRNGVEIGSVRYLVTCSIIADLILAYIIFK